MVSRVAVIAQDPVSFFELGVAVEVFGVDRTSDGVPPFDFQICSPDAKDAVMALPGVALSGNSGLDATAGADLVIVPSAPRDRAPSPDVVEALKATHQRGARVLAMCSGAFALAWAGLLDGRRAATHWRYAAELQAQFPRARVDDSALYLEEEGIVTSAGTAAAIDACLHLVRTDHGSEAAARIARRMVVAPHREGGQKQFIEHPVPVAASSLEPLMQSLMDSLDRRHTVASMAREARMSERTFARHFQAQTGTTPAAWLTRQRVLEARHLLEVSDLGIDHIAGRTGLGSGALLRHHFQQLIGVAPSAYRASFRQASA